MKYLAFITLFCLEASCGFTQQAPFTLKGRINKDSKAKKVYLQGNVINVEIPITTDREFSYTGSLSEPEQCFINTDKSFSTLIWIASDTIDIALQEWESGKRDSSGKKLLKIAHLSGPAESEKFQWFIEQRNAISTQFPNSTFAQYKDSMAKYFDPLLEEYILSHPHSKFSSQITHFAHSKENVKKFLSLVDKEVSTEDRLHIGTAIKRDSATNIGLTVVDFAMKTIGGQWFSSKNLSSDYTLLDFWAHDCYPCRQQHPSLLKIYNEFRGKGFEIVSISLDESKSKWKKAVQQDKLTWVQVSDLKGWYNFLAQRYFVEAIPFNILVDKNKKIVARGLSPNALQEKLNELLKK